MFGGVETDQPQRVLEVGEAPVGGLIRRRNAGGPIRRSGASGVFCNSCDDDNSTQVCGVSPSFKRNSSTRRDLPMPGSPTIRTNWPSPLAARSQRRRKRSSSSSRPTSGVSARAPKRRPPLARTMRKSVDRLGDALELVRAVVLGDEQPGDLTLHVGRDQHRPRLGQRLHARGDIGRVAEHFAGRIHHDRARTRCRCGRRAPARPSRRSGG